MSTPFQVVIPARYASTRLPGKPLLLIGGKPMVQHVYENALSSGARSVIVATEDERIAKAVAGFGGTVALTSPAHASGTDRIAEVAAQLRWCDDDIVVNLQGDEPSISGELVQRAAAALESHSSAGIATLAAPIRDMETLCDPNVVKVVLGDDGYALYFSRAPIPWARDAFKAGLCAAASMPLDTVYLRHIGLYAYRVGVLRRISAEAQREAERAESLEQLRAMAIGIRIHVSTVEKVPLGGVDTEEDLARAAQAL